jgi:hypothetical protein
MERNCTGKNRKMVKKEKNAAASNDISDIRPILKYGNECCVCVVQRIL